MTLRNEDGEGREAGSSEAAIYQITVKGTLDRSWADWFDGLAMTPRDNGETLLSGSLTDQAALHGVLARIRDLGLPLLCVKRTDWGG